MIGYQIGRKRDKNQQKKKKNVLLTFVSIFLANNFLTFSPLSLSLVLSLPLSVDVDECTERPDVCVGQGVCENTLGSYRCVCQPGYKGNGTHCEGQRGFTMRFKRVNCEGQMGSR